MAEVKRIKADFMMPVINNLLENDSKVCLTVTGNSMYPFLRDNKDSVELAKCSFSDVKTGDIILIQRWDSTYVLHRVILKGKSSVYILGDAQRRPEGPIDRNQILAKVDSVWRCSKKISAKNIIWRILTFLWFMLFPFRRIIIDKYRRIRILHRK